MCEEIKRPDPIMVQVANLRFAIQQIDGNGSMGISFNGQTFEFTQTSEGEWMPLDPTRFNSFTQRFQPQVRNSLTVYESGNPIANDLIEGGYGWEA